ncbi:MAG: hypothetical protein ACLGH0_00080, partial [Thermoanaerobaculia bacterium]
MSDLDSLRSECDELSKKRFRVAFVSLVLLFVSVLAFTRAFSRIDNDEVRTRLKELARLKPSAFRGEVSYVFHNTWDEVLAEERARRGDGYEPRNEAAEAEFDRKAAELEQLAVDWFTVEFSLGGADVSFDLRYWLPVLPLLLWSSWAYLGIVGAKLQVARELAQQLVVKDTDVVHRLHFSGSQVYARYPDVLGARLYVVAVVLLVTYFAFVGAPMWALLNDSTPQLVPAQWAFLDLLFVITYFVALLVWRTRWRLELEAADILGRPPRPFFAMRVLEAGRRVASYVRMLIGRLPRTVVTLGSAAVLISPFTMLSLTCEGKPRTGLDLLRGDAVWFTGNAILGESFLPHLGRMFYALTLLLAVAALLPRVARRLRVAAAIAAYFLFIEIGFVLPVSLFGLGNDLVRVFAFGIPLLLWLRNRRRERWREVLRPRIEACLVPAMIVTPIALLRCFVFGLSGIPLYFAGVVAIALPLLAQEETEVAVRAPATLTQICSALDYPASSTFALLNTLRD